MIHNHFKATKRTPNVYKPSPATAEVYKPKVVVETAPVIEPETAELEPSDSGIVVQSHLHENVRYATKGESAMTPVEQKLMSFIQEHFLIPEDFDLDYRFGPLSGVSFEQRVISSYEHNLLVRKEGVTGALPALCTNCAEEGHSRRYCPLML